MGHEIHLQSLQPSEVVDIVRGEFRIVRVDEREGLRRAIAYADWIERQAPKVFLGKHSEALAYATTLRSLTVGSCAVLAFGDTEDNLVSVDLIPGQSLRFDYEGQRDEVMKLPLVERFAGALCRELILY